MGRHIYSITLVAALEDPRRLEMALRTFYPGWRERELIFSRETWVLEALMMPWPQDGVGLTWYDDRTPDHMVPGLVRISFDVYVPHISKLRSAVSKGWADGTEWEVFADKPVDDLVLEGLGYVGSRVRDQVAFLDAPFACKECCNQPVPGTIGHICGGLESIRACTSCGRYEDDQQAVRRAAEYELGPTAAEPYPPPDGWVSLAEAWAGPGVIVARELPI